MVKEICQPFEEEECLLVPREVTNQECNTGKSAVCLLFCLLFGLQYFVYIFSVPERMCSNVERKIPREVCSPVERQSCTPVTRRQCALECNQVKGPIIYLLL